MTTKKKGATTARRAAPAVAPPAPVAAPDEYMSIESACKHDKRFMNLGKYAVKGGVSQCP